MNKTLEQLLNKYQKDIIKAEKEGEKKKAEQAREAEKKAMKPLTAEDKKEL